jgi:transposase
MRDTTWKGKIQKLVFESGENAGKAKGLKQVLKERGLLKDGMRKKQMQKVLGECEDFRNEPTILEMVVMNELGGGGEHADCLFLPKFHCELNPIELGWRDSKMYTRSHCMESIKHLRIIIPTALDTIPKERWKKFYDHVKDWEEAYQKVADGEVKLDELNKTIKRRHKSHRRATAIESGVYAWSTAASASSSASSAGSSASSSASSASSPSSVASSSIPGAAAGASSNQMDLSA